MTEPSPESPERPSDTAPTVPASHAPVDDAAEAPISRRGWFLLWMLLVMTAAAFAHAGGITNGYIWDDDHYVTENATLRTGGEGLRRIWLEPGAVPQYYPMVHTTFWIQYQFAKDEPTQYHVVNIICHALAAGLMFLVLLRLFELPAADPDPRPRPGTPLHSWRKPWWPFAIALGSSLIFAVHPVHVESVAWVTERKNVLSAVFYFAAALLVLKAINWPSVDWRWDRRSVGLHIGAFLLFVAALLSKTVTCSLPAAMLLLLWWRAKPWTRGHTRAAIVMVPWLIVGFLLAMHTAHMERTHVGASGDEWDQTLPEKLLIASRALWFYVGKLAWPEPLVFFYRRWDIDASSAAQWAFVLAWIPVAAGLLYLAFRRGRRGPLVAFLIFGGTLFPALGFFSVYPHRYSFVADHFNYLGSVPAIILAVAAILMLGQALRARLCTGHLFSDQQEKLAFYPEAIALTAVLTTFVVLAYRQTRVYESEETLWRDTIAKNPTAWSAYNNLGDYYRSRGDFQKAIDNLEGALRVKPDHIGAMNNLALAYDQLGQHQRAITLYRRALEIEQRPEIIVNMGIAFAHAGDTERARLCWEQAHSYNRAYMAPVFLLAELERQQENYREAVDLYAQVLRREPQNRSAWIALGESIRKGNIPPSELPDLPDQPDF